MRAQEGRLLYKPSAGCLYFRLSPVTTTACGMRRALLQLSLAPYFYQNLLVLFSLHLHCRRNRCHDLRLRSKHLKARERELVN